MPHDISAGTELVRAVLAGDPGAIAARLADQAAFNSPIRRYADRRDVVHLLTLIHATLPAAQVERTWHGPDGAATVISAVLDEERLDGVIEELHDPDGRIREVTLMLRPHAAMMSVIKRMATALETSPLPSASPPR